MPAQIEQMSPMDIIKQNLTRELQTSSGQGNYSTYKLFKKIQTIETLKINYLTLKENKRIGEVLDSLPNIADLTKKNYEPKLEDYSRKIKEIQRNINDVLSEKVTTEDGKPINISMINLLDYQFIVLNLFSMSNEFIKYRVDMKKVETDPEFFVPVEIPLSSEVLEDIKLNLHHAEKKTFTEKNVEYKVKFDYRIKKMAYDPSSSFITTENIQAGDFETWLKVVELKVNDNIKIIFRFINIMDYMNLYLEIVKLKKMYEIQVDKINFTSRLIDLNLNLFKDLIVAVVYNNELFDAIKDKEFSNIIADQYFNSLSEKGILDITKMVYSSVFRLEIDIDLYDKDENHLKHDVWFDSGISFFLTL